MKLEKITLIELIAVLIILSTIVLMAIPTVVNLIDEKRKNEYIKDVNEFVEKATKMYKDEEQRNNKKLFSKDKELYTIKLSKINSIEKTKDPYNYEYKKEESTITFDQKNKDIIINIKSCKTKKDKLDYCYEIASVSAKKLNKNKIKTSIH